MAGTWNPKLEFLTKLWTLHLMIMKKDHKKAGKHSKILHYFILSMKLTITGSIAIFSVVGIKKGLQDPESITILVLAIVAMILQILDATLQFNKKASDHLQTVKDCDAIIKEIRIQFALPIEYRQDPEVFISHIAHKFEMINKDKKLIYFGATQISDLPDLALYSLVPENATKNTNEDSVIIDIEDNEQSITKIKLNKSTDDILQDIQNYIKEIDKELKQNTF